MSDASEFTAGVAGAVLAADVAVGLATRAPGGLTVAACALATSMVATGLLYSISPPVLPKLGFLVALVAAWLVPQRPDLGSAAILAALFGAGTGLIADRIPAERRRPAVTGALAMLVVLAGLRLVDARPAILIVALLALLVGVISASATHRGAARRRGLSAGLGIPLTLVTTLLTAYFGASTPAAGWFGGGATRGPAASGEVALTFDDGPNLVTTPAVMRILDANHVAGTFFLVGKALDAGPQEVAIVRALIAHGHLIGNHSYHHDQWRWLDPRYPELERTQVAFARDIGVCPAWYRPPHGQRTPFIARVVRDHGMRMAMWDDSAGDWATHDAHLVARRVLRRVRSGSIIDLHDGLDGNPLADRSVVSAALPEILAGLRARHLRPVRLDVLLGGKSSIPCPSV